VKVALSVFSPLPRQSFCCGRLKKVKVDGRSPFQLLVRAVGQSGLLGRWLDCPIAYLKVFAGGTLPLPRFNLEPIPLIDPDHWSAAAFAIAPPNTVILMQVRAAAGRAVAEEPAKNAPAATAIKLNWSDF
jgi:hypothetical protein